MAHEQDVQKTQSILDPGSTYYTQKPTMADDLPVFAQQSINISNNGLLTPNWCPLTITQEKQDASDSNHTSAGFDMTLIASLKCACLGQAPNIFL